MWACTAALFATLARFVDVPPRCTHRQGRDLDWPVSGITPAVRLMKVLTSRALDAEAQ
jgi:hypothetical protein